MIVTFGALIWMLVVTAEYGNSLSFHPYRLAKVLLKTMATISLVASMFVGLTGLVWLIRLIIW